MRYDETGKPIFFSELMDGIKAKGKAQQEYTDSLIEAKKNHLCPRCNSMIHIGPTFNETGEDETLTVICDNCLKAEHRSELFKQFVDKIPPRYANIHDYSLGENLLYSECVLIYGDYGVGKTYGAYSMVKKLFLNENITSFEVAREAKILSDMRKFDGTEEKYRNTDLLVIDEYGKSADTEFSKSQIFDLIDYRYDYLLRTVIICNAKSPEDLKQTISRAVLDRYKGCIKYMEGKSLR